MRPLSILRSDQGHPTCLWTGAGGAFESCIFAPPFGLPFLVPALRQALKK